MKGKISEIFESIQGEGIYFGERQIFVRFFGCNLNSCKFCDTKLDYFREYEAQELFDKINSYGSSKHSVSFTGGEPLLQKGFLKEIMRLTAQSGLKNYLETNGTLPDELKEVIDYADIVAMDLKLPSSTGLLNFWEAHHRFFKIASRREVFLKAVVCQDTQEEDLKEAIDLIKEIKPEAILILQPNSFEAEDSLKEKLEDFKCICRKNNIANCVIPQVHKILAMR